MQATAGCLRIPQQAVFRGQLVPQVPAVLSVGRQAGLRPPSAASSDARCTVEGWRRPLTGSACPTGTALPPMVALGKFDAMHMGHRALAIAAAHLGGAPWLVSFSGMAEVLGWPTRLPLVAPCDRERVLRSWAAACGGWAPRECAIPFPEVRMMSPEAFVQLLADELKVAGVVVGSNYRFGYRAAGNAALLQQLGPQHGLKVRVLDLVGSRDASLDDEEGPTVSSSRVREGLAAGDMAQVEECLGRPYRLVASLQGASLTEGRHGLGIRLGSDAYHNQPPGPGQYAVAASWCPAQGSTVDCWREGWRDARLAIDETGMTVAADSEGVRAWHEHVGVVVLDFQSNREAAE